jgi:hypothetical protein
VEGVEGDDAPRPEPSAAALAHQAYLRRDRLLNIAAYILAAIGVVALFVFTWMAARQGTGGTSGVGA